MIQNILMVDDRPENLFSLEAILADSDRNLIKAESGEEALKILLKQDVALILLDVQMPGMDGFEVASLIRGAPKTKHIPIIFVTALNKEQKHVFRGYEAGAVDYMFKPVDPDILSNKVRIFLELDQKRRILEQKNTDLELSKKNTDNILQNVSDGFFLLDQNYTIIPQYSLALETIFGQKELAGINLIKYLEGKIPAETVTTIKDYFELLFREDLEENSFEFLNPLSELEISNSRNGKDCDIKKVLTFLVKRIYKNDKEISELIVTVSDVTAKIQLARELEKTESNSKKQLEWMFHVLHVEPALLKEFMATVQKELNYIDDLLKNLEIHSEYAKNLTEIFRSMHLVKGNASLLDLKFFVNKAHEFEEEVVKIQKMKKIDGSDFVCLVLQLNEMQNILDGLQNVINRITDIQTHFRPKRQYENELFVQSLQNMINNLAEDLKKEVKFAHKKFDAGIIPYQHRLAMKEIIIQLLRNAIYHGIEDPDERAKSGKKRSGILEISSFQEDDHVGFKLKDDGQGLQIEKLRNKAKSFGKWKKSDVDKWDDKRVAEIIFCSGLSTLEEADRIAGRGVGMDIVKEKIDKLAGKITVNYEAGRYCEFIVTIPKKHKKLNIIPDDTSGVDLKTNSMTEV